MKQAARDTDTTAHGGTITTGCSSVLIGGLHAARVGDEHECPIHGKGKVTQGCGSVIVGGSFASRRGDLAGCATGGKAAGSGGGGPSGAVRGHLGQRRVGGDSGKTGLGFRGANTGAGGKAKFDPKSGVAEAEIHGNKTTAEVYVGKPGDYGANPLHSNKIDVTYGNAKVATEVFVGDDGNRIGTSLGGSAGASMASLKSTQKNTIGFGGYNIQIRHESGVSVASVGAGAGGFGYYDRSEERLHLGGTGKVDLGIGLRLLGDISIGKEYPPGEKPTTDLTERSEFKAEAGPKPDPMDGIPNLITSGFKSVVIG